MLLFFFAQEYHPINDFSNFLKKNNTYIELYIILYNNTYIEENVKYKGIP